MEDLGIDTKRLRVTRKAALSEVSGSYTYFADGDVLLAKITPCFENGKLGVASDLQAGIGFGSSEFFVLRPGARLDKDFLYYWFSRDDFRKDGAARMGGAVGQQRVPREFVEGSRIPLPPLPEQRRIVGILDQALESIASARANAEANIANARALVMAALEGAFRVRVGWKHVRLSDVAVSFGRGRSRHRPRNDPRLYGGDYPFVQTGDIRSADHVVTKYNQTYSRAGLAQSRLWPRGTLCITIAANIAETAVLGFDACFPDSVIGLVPDERVATARFLEYLLQFSKAGLQDLGKGSAQDNINVATFEDQTFPLPPIEVQGGIVAMLDSVRLHARHLESLYRQKLAALDELKQSLLHQAFSGAL